MIITVLFLSALGIFAAVFLLKTNRVVTRGEDVKWSEEELDATKGNR
jgi:hypothetical protein